MEDTPEIIRHQMDETKSHLSQKLESMEQQVSQTVQSAGSAVNATVESVRETVESVTGAVHDAFQSVSNAFDFRRQVDRHPWMVLGGAVAVGYLAAELLAGPATKPQLSTMPSPQPRPSADATQVAPAPETDPVNSFWRQLSNAAIGPLLGIVQDVASRAAPHLIDCLTGQRTSNQNSRQSVPPNSAAPQGANGLRKQLDSA